MTSSENSRNERRKHVLSSLNAALVAFQRAVDSRDICTAISHELGKMGVPSVVLGIDPLRENLQLHDIQLPSLPAETNLEIAGVPVKGTKFKRDTLFQIEFSEEGAVTQCDFGYLARGLGVSSDLCVTSIPGTGIMIPLVNQGFVLVLGLDDVTEREIAWFSVFRDVLEASIHIRNQLKEVEEQKDFSERIIREVQEGILLENTQGKIMFVNPKLLQMLDYTADELIGKHYSYIASSQSLPVAEAETKKRPQGVKSQYEAGLQRKDRSIIPVIVSATPLFENGKYTGNLTVFTDQTTQKKAEEEIRSLKEFSENIIQSLHDALLIEDEKGVITFVNPTVEQLLEIPEKEIVGHHWSEFIAPDYLEKVRTETSRGKKGVSGQYEAALITRSGKVTPVMVGATPLFDNKTFKGIISVYMDLTVMKEKENEIRKRNEDLRLLSRINHALNTGQDLSTILDLAVQEIQKIFDSDAASIMFIEEDGKARLSQHAISPAVRHMLKLEEKPQEIVFNLDRGSLVEKSAKKKRGFLVQEESLREILGGVLTPDMTASIRERTLMKSAVILPLAVEDEVFGVMILGSRQVLGQDDFHRIESLSKHLAVAIHHARLDDIVKRASMELQSHLKEQTTLRELAERLYTTQTEREVLEIVGEQLLQLGHEYLAVLTREDDTTARLAYSQPENLVKRVEKRMEQLTGSRSQLDRIDFTDRALFKESAHRRAAIVTQNIPLHDEKEVCTLSMEELMEVWLGTSQYHELEDLAVLQSAICIPLCIAGECRGAFVVGSLQILTHHDFVILETVGRMVGEALERLTYSEALEKKSQELKTTNEQLSLLQEINNALNSTMDLGEIFRILVKGMSSVFGYTSPSVYLLSEDRTYLLVKEFDISYKLLEGITRLVGFSPEKYKIPLFEGSQLKKVIDENCPLITSDITGFLKDYTDKESLRRLAGALYRMGNVNWVAAFPLTAGEEPVGMMVMGSKKKIEQSDINAISGFLDQAVLAIHKARLYEQLKEANQMKSDFIDLASHELKTPLTSIKLYLEMIRMGRYGQLTPELEEKIHLIQASSNRLGEIIDNTLLSSRKGKKDLDIERISLSELIQDVISQLRPSWESKKQKIEVRGPYKLPPVKADKTAMWKVMAALLENAIKYSPEESRITAKIYDHTDSVEVAIMDEGIGIKQEDQEKIFQPFVIVASESEYKRVEERTGLGLFIAKDIIEQHGGKIWVESVFGLGSTFHFTLPK
ncbi:MAG: PAS domain S-box protein [Theionarchaea archaeon]|nr:PAS domain S-box protein [Theionarchaea archaeon]MBU7040975.1 PAS domain S-box protein [Theionarchaea archaeon]